MILSQRFWGGVRVLAQADMAASMAIAAGLLFWLTWHA
jgi:hypothetical protein